MITLRNLLNKIIWRDLYLQRYSILMIKIMKNLLKKWDYILERIWKLKRVVSFSQNPNGSNVHKSKKRWSKLIITSSNSAKSFDFIEKTLDQMTFLIQPIITMPRFSIVFPWRNGVFCILLGNVSSDFFSTIGFITENITAGYVNFR